MTKIIQISDTHLLREGAFASKNLQPAKSLKNLVNYISQIQLEAGLIDAIIVSGDISDDGSIESYQLFNSIFDPLKIPLFLIPGNHDIRTSFRSVFSPAGYLPASGKLNWYQKVDKLHLIGLDTLIEGEKKGELDEETLTFLQSTLDELGNGPVILMLHHPPFETGVNFMDSIGLCTGRDQFNEVIGAYSGELIVVCGHIHMNMVTQLKGHSVISAPSTYSSFVYNIHNDAPINVLKQEGGFILHVWAQGFKSIRIDAQCTTSIT